MKHKHAEVIKAFVDGVECQVRDHCNDSWYLVITLRAFDTAGQARIKPIPKPDVIRYGYVSIDIEEMTLTSFPYSIDNVKFTFDGETKEIKSVEVIK